MHNSGYHPLSKIDTIHAIKQNKKPTHTFLENLKNASLTIISIFQIKNDEYGSNQKSYTIR